MTDWLLTRTDTSASIALPEDLQWTDEFDWSAVAASSPVRSLSGAMIVQRGVKQSGRPVTLSGDWVWHRYADLLILQQWTDEPELEMTLSHWDGRTFTVCWRHHEQPINANPVLYMTPLVDGDPYTATLNLMTI